MDVLVSMGASDIVAVLVLFYVEAACGAGVLAVFEHGVRNVYKYVKF